METGYGVLEYTENVLRNYADTNNNIIYKVNKTNILVRDKESKNAIMDIYGRIRNDEIRVCIHVDDTKEYSFYRDYIESQIDKTRVKRESKGFLNLSFYIPRNSIEKIITKLLEVR